MLKVGDCLQVKSKFVSKVKVKVVVYENMLRRVDRVIF